ncbi:MAG: sugar phosphate nucleotidyltransferase, partial [Proteobacteria bacterium]|nr:sugar phosphate nucleotidyltransferase [Pseudomonadota bacterium]
MKKNVYAVILAGGSGTRFWPKSRQKSPKQLCKIGNASKTMIEITLDRLEGLVPPERRIIVTHVDQLESTRAIVGNSCARLIAEPEARNTANALAVAALEVEHIHKKSGNSEPAVILSVHADHVIKDVNAMKASFVTAIKAAEQGTLALIGIVPEYAETGYGYIERGSEIGEIPGAFKVASFREKPNLDVAKSFVDSKKFLWNAGLFVFPVDLLLKELSEKLPNTVSNLRTLLSKSKDISFSTIDLKLFAEVYGGLPKISIDHAVLEVSKHVSVVQADMGWKDVGSWEALGQCFSVDSEGNYKDGPVLAIDTTNCTIESDGPLIATLGLSDMV